VEKMDCQSTPTISASPVPVVTTGRCSLFNKLYTLWLALMLMAIVAAGFGLSYFTYAHLVANGPTASVETIGELWESGAP
jgi:hypothetical protein